MAQHTPDYLLLNGQVLTMDDRFSVAQGIAVAGDRILAVGDDAGIRKLAGAATELIDLNGKTVTPGFIDGHAHMDREGLKTLYPSLAGARSIAEIQTIIRREVKRKKPGDWIVTMPLGDPPFYTEALNQLKEGRPPTKDELDAAAPENPVYIRGIFGYWGSLPIIAVANSLALRKAGIDGSTRAPHDGIQIEKDSQTGEPTGVFREFNDLPTLEFTLFKAVPRFSSAQRLDALRESMRKYNECGTTSVCEGHGLAPEVISAYQALHAQDQQTVRAYLALSPTWKSVSEAERVMGEWRDYSGRGSGDHWLRIGGIYLEYGGDAGLARLREREYPYTGWAGFVYKAHTPEEYRTLAELAVQNQLRIHTHVRHDLENPLQILEDIARRNSLSNLRIVFVDLLFATPNQIQRMRRLNIHSTCIPFNHLHKRGLRLLDDPRHAENAVPLNSLLRMEIPAALSTDNAPYDPMETLWAAEARQDETTGETLGTRERISREELLKAFTSNGAKLSFEENLKGKLEAGKLADLIVLSDDPIKVSTEQLRNIEVLLTMVGGQIVHRRGDTPGASH